MAPRSISKADILKTLEPLVALSKTQTSDAKIVSFASAIVAGQHALATVRQAEATEELNKTLARLADILEKSDTAKVVKEGLENVRKVISANG